MPLVMGVDADPGCGDGGRGTAVAPKSQMFALIKEVTFGGCLKPHDEPTSSHLSWEDHHNFRPLGVQLRLELGTTMATNPITIVIYRLITGTALENYCLQRFKRLI